jgi:hypothetical protein
MNPNMPIKSRTRRNTRILPEQETQSPPMAINHQPYMKMEHEHHHYRLMEQQQQKKQETDQMYVLDLSLKNKNNKMNDDVEASMSRDMEDDDDVKMKSTIHHPLQSLLSLNGINKPMYTSNDMTMFWNMLMHFSFNNYNNYFKQQFKDPTGNFSGLKGRF